MKIVNEGRWVVKNMRKFVNVNCERPPKEAFNNNEKMYLINDFFIYFIGVDRWKNCLLKFCLRNY